jgi:peptidoglycan/LPS O-acetylase OafA/YrhL
MPAEDKAGLARPYDLRAVAGRSPQTPEGRATINALQGLRGLAAILVVVNHQIWLLGEKIGSSQRVIDWSGRLGHFGVVVFFIISGFIMVFTSKTAFGTPGGGRTFLLRRMMRIVPLYWAATLISFVRIDFRSINLHSLAELATSLAFIPFRGASGDMSPVHGVGWTLNYEMFFYVLFAFWITKLRRAGLVGLVATFAGLIAAHALFAHTAFPPRVQDALSYWTSPIIIYFVFGVLLFVTREMIGTSNIRLKTSLATTMSGIALLTALYFVLDAYVPGASGIRTSAFAILVTSLAVLVKQDHAVDGGLDKVVRKGCDLIGDASFSIYLTHEYLIDFLLHIRWQSAGALGLGVYYLAGFLGAIGLGLMLHRFVEAPLLEALKRAVRPLREAAAASNGVAGPYLGPAYPPSE